MRRGTSSLGIFFWETIESALIHCAGDQIGAGSARVGEGTHSREERVRARAVCGLTRPIHSIVVAKPTALIGAVLNKTDMQAIRRYDNYHNDYYSNKHFARYGYTA